MNAFYKPSTTQDRGRGRGRGRGTGAGHGWGRGRGRETLTKTYTTSIKGLSYRDSMLAIERILIDSGVMGIC